MKNFYDVIIIGAGHAGVEAASASSRIGCKTLLLTNNIDSIGQMSCNPSIGGIGKSHLVKEIDALGGIMSIAIDKSGIQFRKLNTSKGPAVQSTRAQADRILYQIEIKKLLFSNKNLTILQQKVTKLIIKNNIVKGVITNINIKFYSNSIVLCLGTFLDGKIYIGSNHISKGGRLCDISSIELNNQLKDIFLLSKNRLKTGTPPRLDIRDINFSNLQKQNSDYPLPMFSFIKQKNFNKQLSCFITKTNITTHNIIKENINKNPIYNNLLKSIGPRYCPSIEDKIIKFYNKNSHQIFLEPEGLNSYEIYPNGISTSFSMDIQIKIVNSIKGLEKCKIIRPGYAVEYSFLDPKNLKHTLESKIISNLFISGQLNGTTGYEEAAAQGLISGLNAAMSAKNKSPWIPKRNFSYIGVMIDDLCNYGIIEPYRIFTSRSENRLFLREDNADLRLTEIGRKLKLINNTRWKIFNNRFNNIIKEKNKLKKITININNIKILNKKSKNKDLKEINGYNLLKFNKIKYEDLLKIEIFNTLIKKKYIYKTIEYDIKYENYIIKQNKEIKYVNNYKNILIPKNINYNNIIGLSNEVKYLFKKFKPLNINEAINISGTTPSSIFILIMWIKNNDL